MDMNFRLCFLFLLEFFMFIEQQNAQDSAGEYLFSYDNEELPSPILKKAINNLVGIRMVSRPRFDVFFVTQKALLFLLSPIAVLLSIGLTPSQIAFLHAPIIRVTFLSCFMCQRVKNCTKDTCIMYENAFFASLVIFYSKWNRQA
uniref:Uncharacterized protein LOC111109953 isoform X1 n=1 Tax=Crassostrea virginica TaxID=6565 RepID=A0A8B8BGL2_CRAVI|nr:uncharacterized protein LOC111109953 isoform X1 [Crassostrea virginica]